MVAMNSSMGTHGFAENSADGQMRTKIEVVSELVEREQSHVNESMVI